MGHGNEQHIQLRRDSPATAWGFRLQGGKEFNAPLSVQRVFNGSPSDGQLQRGDVILSVDNRDVTNLQMNQAQDLMKNSGLVINIAIARTGSSDFNYNTSFDAAPSNDQPKSYNGGDFSKAYSSSPERSASGQKPWTSQQTYQPAPFSSQQAPSYNSQASFGQQQPSHSDRYNTPETYSAPQQPKQFGQPARNHAGPSLDYNTDNQNYYDPPSASTYKTSTTSFTPQQPEVRKSTATHTFAKQSSPFQGDSWGGDHRGGQSGDQYESNVVRPTVIQHEEEDEGYEQHSVTDIKQLFNKPDQTGQRAMPRIKRAQPKAPTWKTHEDLSHHQFDSAPHPAPIKSSLTPSSRPGSIQRGAPDNHPTSYVPMHLPDTHSQQVKRPGQYGYAVDPAPAAGGKYVGGFVGVSALTKPLPKPTLPKKTPPGQKKPDFDPAQSSVLRVLQEEEARAKNNPQGQNDEEEEEPRRPQPGQHQQRHPPGQQQRQQPGQQRTQQGQQRQQQPGGSQQQAPRRGGPPPGKPGVSLQALLERDQIPKDDQSREHSVTSPDYAGGVPGQSSGEYRRPGTNYKPSQVKVAPQAGSLEDYPFPAGMSQPEDPYGYPAAGNYSNTGYSGAGNYQSSSYPLAQPGRQQTNNYQSSSAYSAAQYPASNYPTGNYKGGNYPATDYDAHGVPASDF